MTSDRDEIQAEFLFHEGTRFYEKGQLKEAEQKLQQALRLMPASDDILYNLALVYLEFKQYDKVRSLIQRIAAIDCTEIIKALSEEQPQARENILCMKCIHYEADTGSCTKIKENVKDYPKKFIKKCNGELFKGDPQKTPEDVLLRQQDEAENMETPPNLVELPIYANRLSDMTTIQIMLESMDIPFHISNERYYFPRPRPVPIKILVREEDAQQVMDLIKGLDLEASAESNV